MPQSTASDLTTTGEVVVQPDRNDREVRVTAVGTYTGLQGKVQGSADGTNYVDLAVTREDTLAPVTGTVNLSAANLSLVARVAGWPYVRFHCTQLSTGTATVTVQTAASFGTPPPNGVSLTTGFASTSPSAGVGYAAGAGGAVTQASSRTTGVTLNTVTGAITLVSAAGSATPFTVTVTNSAVAATDTVVACQKSGADAYAVAVSAVAAGSFKLTVTDLTGTTTEQPVINFAVVKGAAS